MLLTLLCEVSSIYVVNAGGCSTSRMAVRSEQNCAGDMFK